MQYLIALILVVVLVASVVAFLWLSNERSPEQLTSHREAAQIVAFLGTPIVVALLGAFISFQNNRSQTSVQYVQLAIDILKDEDTSTKNKPIREYALSVLDKFSPIEFTDEVGEALRTSPLPSAATPQPTAEEVTPYEENDGRLHTLYYEKHGRTEWVVDFLLSETGEINFIRRGQSKSRPVRDGWEIEVLPPAGTRYMHSSLAEHRELAAYLITNWLSPLGTSGPSPRINEIRSEPSEDQTKTVWIISGSKDGADVEERFETEADRHIMM